MRVAVFQSAIYVASLESARQLAIFEVENEAKQVKAIPNPALSAISTSLKGITALQAAINEGAKAIVVTRMGNECLKRAAERGVAVITVKEGTKVNDALRDVIGKEG